MANTLLNPSVIAKESLFQLENNIVMGGLCHREYKSEFRKVGDTVTIRRPVKFVVSDGATRVNQDVIEPNTSITINKRKHVSWNFDSNDLTLTIEEYSERYITPAMIALADKIDRDLMAEAVENFYVETGAAGTTPANFSSMTNVARLMDERSVPDKDGRHMVLSPAARWSLAATLGAAGSTSIYNPDIVEGMVRRGYLGNLAGLSMYGDQNVPRFAFGARPTTATNGVGLVNDTVAVGDTTVDFDTAGSSVAGYLKKGDLIQFAGVNAVNPVNGEDLGYLATWVVTADVTTTAAAGTIPVYPEFNDGSVSSTAAFKNCTALPANNAGIQVPQHSTPAAASMTYPINLAFHRNALALVMVDLVLPDSANFKARAAWNDFSIRVVKDYDIDNDQDIIRLDVLYGVKAIYPELGVRLIG